LAAGRVQVGWCVSQLKNAFVTTPTTVYWQPLIPGKLPFEDAPGDKSTTLPISMAHVSETVQMQDIEVANSAGRASGFEDTLREIAAQQ
jgi:hypothetical protein